jgi:hypothetical protein
MKRGHAYRKKQVMCLRTWKGTGKEGKIEENEHIRHGVARMTSRGKRMKPLRGKIRRKAQI